MKLITLTLPVEKPKALRMQREIDLRNPVNDVLGWTILVRGPAVIMIPPKDSPDPGGFEIARSACTLRWDSSSPADYDKLGNFTSDPLARPKPVEVDEGKAVAK